jgi:hypothetical protein
LVAGPFLPIVVKKTTKAIEFAENGGQPGPLPKLRVAFLHTHIHTQIKKPGFSNNTFAKIKNTIRRSGSATAQPNKIVGFCLR